MTLRMTAALAAFAVALIFAACGGDGGIDVVSDDERQEREATLDRELDGDARRSSRDSDGAPEVVYIESLDASIEVRDFPCFPDEGFVRMSDGRVGCALVAELADIVSCDEDSRPVVDFADLPDDAGSPLTTCIPFEDMPDEVIDTLDPDN